MGVSSSSCAVLSCDGPYTSFSFGGHDIRFRTPKNLVRYVDVREWNKGYLVVNAEYDGCPEPVEEYIDRCPEPVEEYIDLVPILSNLYFDVDEFLAPIEEVAVA